MLGGLVKGIYKANVSSNPGKGRFKRTYIDRIGAVLQKDQMRSTSNWHACMVRCMNVDEAKSVYKARSRWLSVVSNYPHGEMA